VVSAATCPLSKLRQARGVVDILGWLPLWVLVQGPSPAHIRCLHRRRLAPVSSSSPPPAARDGKGVVAVLYFMTTLRRARHSGCRPVVSRQTSCKRMFQVFQGFHMHVTSVLCGCCESRSACCICCNGYTRLLQASVQNVSSVFSDVCC
jgi:hypothetical protein